MAAPRTEPLRTSHVQRRPLTSAEQARNSRAGVHRPDGTWTEPRNGMPDFRPYVYRGSDRDMNTTIRPAALNGNATPAPPGPKALKGAVKVDAFSDRCKYPFREIASDGGVWRIDPAQFGAKALAVYTAARKWATDHGMQVKVITDDGMVYVQFGKPSMIPGTRPGGSARNGIPEPTSRIRRLTPQQREAARTAAVEQRNHELRAAATRARALAWHPDMPRTCICDWTLAHGAAYVRTRRDPGCPYHVKD